MPLNRSIGIRRDESKFSLDINRPIQVPTGDETLVRVFNINTQTVADVIVQTPGGHVTYEGDLQIDGVPGTAAPIKIDFRNAAGSKTNALLPTGAVCEKIDGVPVSCVDMAMPMLLLPAAALGKTGYETQDALNADTVMLAYLERLRLEASWRMGLGDARDRVIPKVALIAPPQGGYGVCSTQLVDTGQLMIYTCLSPKRWRCSSGARSSDSLARRRSQR